MLCGNFEVEVTVPSCPRMSFALGMLSSRNSKQIKIDESHREGKWKVAVERGGFEAHGAESHRSHKQVTPTAPGCEVVVLRGVLVVVLRIAS
jgi:hypothetical protein